MNIKKLIPTLLISSIGFLAFAQVEIMTAPRWQVTLQVVDESGLPVVGANAYASYYIPPPPNATEAGSRKSGLTDTNGLVTLTAHSGPWIGCGADKDGYYPSSGLEFSFKAKIGDAWQPWNPTGTLYLKKIGQPIPMYAKSILMGLSVTNKTVGYDLIAGDWVVPYGKGQTADIIFKRELNKQSKHDYDDKLTVSFANSGDGIQMFTVPDNEKYSGLRSPHEAPQDGYQPALVKDTSEHPGQQSKFDFDENRIYLFRVRTVLDENGNVKSALYGKIYGDFMQFSYYLNPTPNSRNIEFDPKQNLLAGLKSFEQVKQP